jgi:hypothetical protein
VTPATYRRAAADTIAAAQALITTAHAMLTQAGAGATTIRTLIEAREQLGLVRINTRTTRKPRSPKQ